MEQLTKREIKIIQNLTKIEKWRWFVNFLLAIQFIIAITMIIIGLNKNLIAGLIAGSCFLIASIFAFISFNSQLKLFKIIKKLKGKRGQVFTLDT